MDHTESNELTPSLDPNLPEPIPRDERESPWAQVKYYSFSPTLYPNMIQEVSHDCQSGGWTAVYDREGRPFGYGLYHSKARVALRMFYHGNEKRDESRLDQLVDEALDLRLVDLKLPEKMTAYRVINSDGDGLSGLIIDIYDRTLKVEMHSLGIFERISRWIPKIMERTGATQVIYSVDPDIARMERIRPYELKSDQVRRVKCRENGIRLEVDFESGHKTGFFCDQRENRLKLASMVKGKSVLDLCCYTGGFALAAKVLGEAEEVTGVDLDEAAIAQAKRNANLNQARISWVHCDAFSYARQMTKNEATWDVVVVDPPKLVFGKGDEDEGMRKYEDLNRLAATLVRPGGLLVTCSCSGKVTESDFEKHACRGIHRAGRRFQILDRTGAGPDHPIYSNCPEGRYLKVIWGRILKP